MFSETFRQFIEAQFSVRRARKLGLLGDPNVGPVEPPAIRKEYNGWDIWFFNKQKKKAKEDMPIRDFEEWLQSNWNRVKQNIIDETRARSVYWPERITKISSLLSDLVYTYELNQERGWDRGLVGKEKNVKGSEKSEKELLEQYKKSAKKMRFMKSPEDYEGGLKAYFNDEKKHSPIEQIKKEEEPKASEIFKHEGWKKLEESAVNFCDDFMKKLFYEGAKNSGFNSDESKWLYSHFRNYGQDLEIRYINSDNKFREVLKQDGELAAIHFLMDYIYDHYVDFLSDSKSALILLQDQPKNYNDLIEQISYIEKIITPVVFHNMQNEFFKENGHQPVIRRLTVPDIDFNSIDKDQLTKIVAGINPEKKRGEYALADVMAELLMTPIYQSISEYNPTDYGSYEDKIFQEYIKKCMSASKKVIDVLTSFGLRRFHKVPFIFHHQDWNEPSGYGTSNKVGDAYSDHVNVYGNASEDEIINTLSHEIGHIVFAKLSYDEQQRIKELAYGINIPRLSGNFYKKDMRPSPVSDYGKPSFVYQGRQNPSNNHLSGNEWFATVIEYFAKHHDVYANKLPSVGLLAKPYSSYYDPKNSEELQKNLNAIQGAKQIFAGATNTNDPRKTYAKIPPETPKIRPPRRIAPRYKPLPKVEL